MTEGTGSSGASSCTPSASQEPPPPILLTCTSESYQQPEGPRIYTSSEEVPASIIHLLFTDILGERSYRSVLRFSRPFIIVFLTDSLVFRGDPAPGMQVQAGVPAHQLDPRLHETVLPVHEGCAVRVRVGEWQWEVGGVDRVGQVEEWQGGSSKMRVGQVKEWQS